MRRSPAAFALPRRASAPKERLPLRFFVVATAIIGTFVQPGAGRAQQNPPASPGRPALPAQQDPVVGNWRGTLTSASGESAIIITIAKKGDAYVGSTNGLNASSESALKRVAVNGSRLTIEAADDSKLGAVILTAELNAEGNAMKGAGTLAVGAQKFDVTLALQRRPRAEAIQPHVEQRIDYFVGRWRFEYVGAEYPPLSAGSRGGTATFTRAGASNFVGGTLDGELLGKPYKEHMSMGLDPETYSLAVVERRPDGVELVSVGRLTHTVFSKCKIYQEWGERGCGDAHDLSERASDGICQDKNI